MKSTDVSEYVQKIIIIDEFFLNGDYENEIIKESCKLLESKQDNLKQIISPILSAALSHYSTGLSKTIDMASTAIEVNSNLIKVANFTDDFCSKLKNKITEIRSSLPNLAKMISKKSLYLNNQNIDFKQHNNYKTELIKMCSELCRAQNVD
jgi:hypothetical protein